MEKIFEPKTAGATGSPPKLSAVAQGTIAKPLTRSKAWACATVNQVVFPGIGTIMAGRRVGYLQAALMLAGFCLTMACMLRFTTGLIAFMARSDWSEAQYAELSHEGWAGVGAFALSFVAWFWALASSIAILRSASSSPGVAEMGHKDFSTHEISE